MSEALPAEEVTGTTTELTVGAPPARTKSPVGTTGAGAKSSTVSDIWSVPAELRYSTRTVLTPGVPASVICTDAA
jgi:hypothetical protein